MAALSAVFSCHERWTNCQESEDFEMEKATPVLGYEAWHQGRSDSYYLVQAFHGRSKAPKVPSSGATPQERMWSVPFASWRLEALLSHF